MLTTLRKIEVGAKIRLAIKDGWFCVGGKPDRFISGTLLHKGHIAYIVGWSETEQGTQPQMPLNEKDARRKYVYAFAPDCHYGAHAGSNIICERIEIKAEELTEKPMTKTDKVFADELWRQACNLLINKKMVDSYKPENQTAFLNLLRQVIIANPRHHKALHGLAIFHYGNGDYVLAQEYWQRALEIQPKTAKYHSNLASAEFMIGSIMTETIRDRLKVAVKLSAKYLDPTHPNYSFTVRHLPVDFIAEIKQYHAKQANILPLFFGALLMGAGGAALVSSRQTTKKTTNEYQAQ